MKPEVRILLDLVDEAFDRRSWHGTNLRGSIRGLDAEAAAWRPRRGRHNIWEIAVHAAYWKYVVRRRLTGEKRGSFAYPGSNWFPRPASGTERAWRDDVALLVAEHRKLKTAIAGRKLAGALRLVRGVAAHDLYHAGQIQLLKRLQRG